MRPMKMNSDATQALLSKFYRLPYLEEIGKIDLEREDFEIWIPPPCETVPVDLTEPRWFSTTKAARRVSWEIFWQ